MVAPLVSAAVAPAIIQQPANALAGTNEDIAFSVAVGGTPPFNFQWLYNGTVLPAQTNSSLILTNLAITESGNFSVTVANSAGSVTSSNAILFVQTNIVRRLGTGRILQAGSAAAVPITFRSNGRESSVSFSVSYSTSVFSNPGFSPADATATTTVDTGHVGFIGIAVTLPAGRTFPAGYQWIGLLHFDLGEGQNSLQAGLGFTPVPIPIAAVNSNGQALNISALVQPQFTLMTTNPVLRAQSGLFEHQLVLSNPGSTTMTNLDILALNPGIDSVSNAITFFNAEGSQTNLPYGDPLISIGCDCACGLYVNVESGACTFDNYLACGQGNCSLDYSSTNTSFSFAQINNLLPGESRLVMVEFYVSDHFTVPTFQYSLFLTDPFLIVLPSAVVTTLAIDSSRYLSNSFIVEFSTVLGKHYYIQYADTLAGLATAQTVLPPVIGTGSRVQWIDNGPPKTVSPPVNGARFYRVLSDQE